MLKVVSNGDVVVLLIFTVFNTYVTQYPASTLINQVYDSYSLTLTLTLSDYDSTRTVTVDIRSLPTIN